MGEPGGAQVLWSVAVLQGPARVVTGTVGPFPTPGAAEGHAKEHRSLGWRVGAAGADVHSGGGDRPVTGP